MGYFKSTTYYGSNCQDFSDNSPEARAERKPQGYSATKHLDKPECDVCGKPAPTGYLWADGICTDCRDLTDGDTGKSADNPRGK